jgi:hypothetical protein
VVRRALPLIAPPPFLSTPHREILDWRRKDLKGKLERGQREKKIES